MSDSAVIFLGERILKGDIERIFPEAQWQDSGGDGRYWVGGCDGDVWLSLVDKAGMAFYADVGVERWDSSFDELGSVVELQIGRSKGSRDLFILVCSKICTEYNCVVEDEDENIYCRKEVIRWGG